MKIGILTQPLGHNYGGVLQNWALQQVLIGMGHEPVTFDLRMPRDAKRRSSFVRRLMLMFLTGFRYRPFSLDPSSTDPKFKKLREFKKSHIHSTQTFFPPVDPAIAELRSAGAIIVGSDQVWRPSYSPDLLSYFCKFCADDQQVKKIAYAASFGSSKIDFPESILGECANLLQRFDAVSVRENSAVEQCRKMFDVKTTVVLDPVLLLETEDYLQISDVPESESRDLACLASYTLDSNATKTDIVNEVARNLCLEVKELRNVSSGSALSKIYAMNRPLISPSSWVHMIHHSEFVVTDSFHGMCFSLIFKRPFIVIGNTTRGLDRFVSLLHTLGLKDRLVQESAGKEEIQHLLNQNINWDVVDSRLGELREKSIFFLENALSKIRGKTEV